MEETAGKENARLREEEKAGEDDNKRQRVESPVEAVTLLCIPERESTAQLPKVTLTLKYEPVPPNGPGFINFMKSAIAFLFDSTLK